MNDKFLKEFTYEYIILQDNLTSDDKLQIASFVQNASNEQVMALLLTGECKNKLQEGEAEFVRNLFNATPLPLCESYLNEVGAEDPFSAADAGVMGKAAAGAAVKGSKAAVKGGKAASVWLKNFAQKWQSLKVDPAIHPEMPLGPGKLPTKVKGYADVAGLRGAEPSLSGWQTQYKAALDAVQHNKAIGAIVMAAIIALVARKVYKSYLSKAARACKGAADKKVCMKQYEVKAIQAQIKELQSSSGACGSTKNPAKCKAAIAKKIMKAKKKLTK